jgi:outer membrane protein assembly factor BamB
MERTPAAVAATVLAGVLASLLAVGHGRAEDWPQFRGVNASGVSTSASLPIEFSFQNKVKWEAPLGDGIGSAVIASGRVFNTAMTGEQRFSLFAHDAATGKPLWKRDYDTGVLPRITPPNSHASSTAASDGKRVFAYFSTLGMIAVDAATGAELWQAKLPKPAYLMDWGAASSPVVYKDLVLFCQDDDLAPYLVALDAATGAVRWRANRGEMLAGYSIPVLCEANGRTDVVVAGSGKLKGYDPATGAERWTCNTMLRTMMTSPVVKDGVIYVAVQSYGDATRTLKFALLEWLDTNQDGILARKEVPKEFWEKFDASDRNKDGYIGTEEIDTAFQHPANQVGGGSIIQAIRGGGSGDVTKTHVLWNLENRSPSNLSSPLVSRDRLLVVKAGGLSSCFEVADGKPLWQLSRIKNLGEYYASPIAADGKIYIAGRNGFIVVLEDGPAMKVLARNDMGNDILATPSIADGRLFIRTRDKIYCVAE